jgi:hypothetical protein
VFVWEGWLLFVFARTLVVRVRMRGSIPRAVHTAAAAPRKSFCFSNHLNLHPERRSMPAIRALGGLGERAQ